MKTTRFDDLKKIYLLKTLVTQKSMSKTAQVHRVTASAISQSIKSLEISLGYPVITKSGDSWNLTPKGAELLEQSEPIFLALQSTFSEDEVDELVIGSLSIGTYESLALDIVPTFSARLKKDHPKAKLQFQISRSAELIKKIQSGELCSAILVKSEDVPETFFCETLFSDRMGIFCSGERLKKSLSDEQDILMGTISPGSSGYPHYFRKFLKAHPDFKPNIACDSFEVLRGLAERGEAIVALPLRLAEKSDSKLVEIDVTASSHVGFHEIVLAASGTCDRREFDYLSMILKSPQG